MIRTGRPAFHIKAYTISFKTPNGDVEFYELNQKGELVRSGQNRQVVPHHIVKESEIQIKQNQFQNNSQAQAPNLYYNQQYQAYQFQNQQFQNHQLQYLQYMQQYHYQQPQNDQMQIEHQFKEHNSNEQHQNQHHNNDQKSEEQDKIEETFFDLNSGAIEDSSDILFGIDPNDDFPFLIENEIDLI